MANKNSDFKTNLKTLEDTIDLYLNKKAPSLPSNIKDVIVSVMPFLVLIFVVISLPALLAVLGIGAIFAPFAFWGDAVATSNMLISLLLVVPAVVLEALAVPGLFARTKMGWNFLFYSTLLSAVHSLITFNLVGLIIGTLLSLYILFQVRSYYK